MKKNNKRFVILIACLICVIAVATIYGCSVIKKNKSNADSKALASNIDTYVENVVKDKNFSGSVLVAKGGKVILSKGYGMSNYELDVKNTKDTKFKLGAITEQFTAAAILQLEDKGKLNVEDTVSKYLSTYPGGDNITIYQLLTHTSGIPNYTSFENYKNIMASEYTVQNNINDFKNKALLFEPGTKYKFSNSDYILLGAIIEKVSGKSYGEYLNENIFRPLKMESTGYFNEKDIIKNKASGYDINDKGKVTNVPYSNISHDYAASGIMSTVEDLYLWDRSLYTDKILSSSAKESMFALSKGQKYGFGWLSDVNLSRKVAWQYGASLGFTNNITRYYKDDSVIIILSNKTLDTSILEKMSSNIAVYLFQ